MSKIEKAIPVGEVFGPGASLLESFEDGKRVLTISRYTNPRTHEPHTYEDMGVQQDATKNFLTMLEKPKRVVPQINNNNRIFKDSGLQQDARDTFLRMLARPINKNPKTGQPYTTSELEEIFNLKSTRVRDIIREGGDAKFIKPVVKEGPLPPEQNALFRGLALGNFQVNRTKWIGGGEDFVMIGTQSNNQQQRERLKRTFGTWGTVRDSEDMLRIYLHTPTFDFILDPLEDGKEITRILATKNLFTPFLLGVLGVRLSEQQNRISLTDKTLLNRINSYFIKHFGFSLGSIRSEKSGNKTIYYFIRISQVEEVFSALIQTKSGQELLPFLRDSQTSPSNQPTLD